MVDKRGIVYNEAEQRYDTPWGWVKWVQSEDDPDKMQCHVSGPSPEEWFDLEGAQKTAELFMKFSGAPVLMLLTVAIHQQYASWSGLKGLQNSLTG